MFPPVPPTCALSVLPEQPYTILHPTPDLKPLANPSPSVELSPTSTVHQPTHIRAGEYSDDR